MYMNIHVYTYVYRYISIDICVWKYTYNNVFTHIHIGSWSRCFGSFAVGQEVRTSAIGQGGGLSRIRGIYMYMYVYR
jgi:hypothetical protein